MMLTGHSPLIEGAFLVFHMFGSQSPLIKGMSGVAATVLKAESCHNKKRRSGSLAAFLKGGADDDKKA